MAVPPEMGQLASLDVSGCKDLLALRVPSAQLTEVKAKACPCLALVDVASPLLEQLDVSHCTQLQALRLAVLSAPQAAAQVEDGLQSAQVRVCGGMYGGDASQLNARLRRSQHRCVRGGLCMQEFTLVEQRAPLSLSGLWVCCGFTTPRGKSVWAGPLRANSASDSEVLNQHVQTVAQVAAGTDTSFPPEGVKLPRLCTVYAERLLPHETLQHVRAIKAARRTQATSVHA